MNRVVQIKFQSNRSPLQSTPEKFSSFFDDVVFREGAQELGNLVEENVLKDIDSQIDTDLIVLGLIGFVQISDSFEFESQSGGVLFILLYQLFDKGIGVLVELGQFCRGVSEASLEVVPGPLDGVLDLVGEVLEGAQGDGFLGWVNDVVVADGIVGDDNLGVALGSEGSTFEEGFLVPHALLVDVLSGLDIVHCVDDEVQAGEEIVVEDYFVFWADSELHALEVGLGVHLPAYLAGGLALVAAYVLFSEQELPVEVADFDVVVVSAVHGAVSLGGQAHQGEHLDEFAAEGPGADQE